MTNCIGKHCEHFERSEKYALDVYCNFVYKKSLNNITDCSIAEEVKHQIQLDILENLNNINNIAENLTKKYKNTITSIV